MNAGPYGAGNFQMLLLLQFIFILCQPNFMRTLATMVKYRPLLFLAICQKIKILWHFEVLTCQSMRNPKMWNISKTADSRVKWTKICDSGYYSANMQGTFDAGFIEFGLGSFSALCKISNFRIFKNSTPLPAFISFHFYNQILL